MKTNLTLLLVLFAVSCGSDDKPKPETAKEKQTRVFEEKADDKPETPKEKQTRVFKEKATDYLTEVRAGAKLMDSSLTLNVAVAKQQELKELYAHLPDVPPDFDKTVKMAVVLGSFDDDFGRAIILVTARRNALRLKIDVEDRKLDANDPVGMARKKSMIRECAAAADMAVEHLKELSDVILDRVRFGQAVLDGDHEIVATYVKREKERQAAEAAEQAERKQRELETSGAKAYDAFPVGQRPQLIRDYNKELDRLKEFVRVSEINLAAAKSDKDRESRASVRARALENLAKHERNKPPFITPERAKQFKIKR